MRSIDAFGPDETEAFWRMMKVQAAVINPMPREVMPPDMRQALEGRYRLSFVCPACSAEHRVEGGFVDMAMATQVLLLQGIQSIAIEPLAYALAMDVEEADHILETAKPGDDATINHALDAIFKGKP